MEYLVAPTEPKPIANLGPSSSIPETFGVDVLWESTRGFCGVQRKEYMDLIASVRQRSDAPGTRLGQELSQMKRLMLSAVVIEGTPRWTTEGTLLSEYTQWNLRQQRGVELAIQREGAWILRSRSALETCEVIDQFAKWSEKEGPSSLLYGGKPGPDEWGDVHSKDFAIHFMSTIPLIGTELARRIYERFGRVPIRWDCELVDLLSVEGIGPKRGAALMNMLEIRGNKEEVHGATDVP